MKRLLTLFLCLSLLLSLTTLFSLSAEAATAALADTGLSKPAFQLENVVGGVKSSWEAVAGAEKYRVYRYNESTKKWDTLVNTKYLHFTDTTAKSGETYKYAVKCITPSISAYDTHSIKFIAAPVVRVDNVNAGPTVKWAAVTGAEKYRVFIKNGTSWKKLGDTAETSLVHTGFAYNTKYTYTVRCISADAKKYTSGYDSKGVTSKILETPKVTTTLRPADVKISWNKVAGAKKYRLYYKNKTGSWLRYVETTNTSFVDTGVTTGTGHYYTVRVITEDGVTLSGFQSSSFTTFYEAPMIQTIYSSSTKRTLYWDQIDGVAKYRVFSWNGKKWVKQGDTASTHLEVNITGADYQNVCYAIRCMNSASKYLSSYYENLLKGNYIYSYLPPEYTKDHTV